MGSGRMASGKLLGGMVSFCADCGGRSSNPVNLVNPVENAPRVLFNPLARRRGGSFPAEEFLDRIYRMDRISLERWDSIPEMAISSSLDVQTNKLVPII